MTLALLAVAAPASATYPGKNGRIIVHAFNPKKSRYDLYRAFTPDGLKKITTKSAMSPTFPEWDPTGSTLAADCHPVSYSEVCLLAPNGDFIDQITNVVDDNADAYQPSWSPNGERIVFAGGDGTNMDSDLFIVPSDGSAEPTALTTGSNWSEAHPEWSPNGRWIVFKGQNQQHSDVTFRIRPDGTDRQMVFDRQTLGMGWSPDSEWLVFSRMIQQEGTADIFRMKPNGSDVERLMRTPNRDEWEPVLSPNGRSIVFIEDSTKIVRVRLQSGERDVNHHAPGNFGSPTWRPLVTD